MHIFHIVESFGAGCLTAVTTLCQSVQEDFQHSVAYSLRDETPEDFIPLFPDSVKFYPVSMRTGLEGIRAFSALCGLLRALHPQIVHCHSSKAGFWGRMAARTCGVPSVYTPHAYAFLRRDVGVLTRGCFWAAEWVGARVGNAIAACGQEEYRQSLRLTGKLGMVRCIRNSLDIGELDQTVRPAQTLPPPADCAAGKVLAGTCGRMTAQHNPDLFASLSNALHDHVAWIWIGAEVLDQQRFRHVFCTGWLDRAAALAQMARLDIYVQTSLWDGLPFAVLEAMALSKPTVVTDTPPNREIVRHGVTGFIGATAEALSAYVRLLAGDPQLRARMGAAARQYVLENHNAATVYEAYAKIYRSLAEASLKRSC